MKSDGDRRPFHVALVSEHASPLALVGGVDAGGQNVHLAGLAEHFGRMGARVSVFTRRDDPALPATVAMSPAVTVHHLRAGPPIPTAKDELLPFMAPFAEQLVTMWSNDRPDVVYSHFWMSGFAARRAAERLGLPLAHNFHALGAVKRRHQGAADTSPPERMAHEAELARNVDLIIAMSDDEASELDVLGAPRERIRVVAGGVDLDQFKPDGPAEPRPDFGHRMVVLSRLIARKGIDDAITAVSYLPPVELIIAGGPPHALLDADPEARRYRALIESLGIADRVELRGAVSRQNVPALLRSADAVCCTPWYEPFSLAAIEAMACGVPVIASNIGGLGESIVHGETGLRVPPRQPIALAQSIQRLLSNPGQRALMGATAVRWARRFGWHDVARETLAHLRNLAARDGAGEPSSPVFAKSSY